MALDELDITSFETFLITMLPADGTNQRTLIDTKQYGRVILRITVSSNAAAAHVLNQRTSNTPNSQIGSVDVPAGSGFAAAPIVDALKPCLPSGRTFMRLAPSTYVYAQLDVTLGAGEVMPIVVETGSWGPVT